MDNATLDDNLDKLLRVTTRTETQVLALVKIDAGTRLTKLETSNKVLKWVGTTVVSILSLVLTYFGITTR